MNAGATNHKCVPGLALFLGFPAFFSIRRMRLMQTTTIMVTLIHYKQGCTTILYRMARNFSRTTNFCGFCGSIMNLEYFILENPTLNFFNHTYCAYVVRGATCQHMTFSHSWYTLLSCCVAMALYRYFQASEKSSCKLHDPHHPLSRLVPLPSIISANEKVQSVLESKERLKVDNATPSSLPN